MIFTQPCSRSHGQHCDRTVYAMCSVHALITSTVVHMEKMRKSQKSHLHSSLCNGFISFVVNASLPNKSQKEHQVYQKLSQLVPCLSEHLMVATEEDIMMMTKLAHLSPMQELQKPFYLQKLQKGISAAYQKFKGHCCGLDNPMQCTLGSASVLEHQDKQGFPSCVTG
jgi:hypothetical protein